MKALKTLFWIVLIVTTIGLGSAFIEGTWVKYRIESIILTIFLLFMWGLVIFQRKWKI